jgi:RNA 3'-terminal phosphate cyclase
MYSRVYVCTHELESAACLPARLPAGLGERGVPAEAIGERAGTELMDALASGACTDEWLQDQLIIFMALAQVGGM